MVVSQFSIAIKQKIKFNLEFNSVAFTSQSLEIQVKEELIQFL